VSRMPGAEVTPDPMASYESLTHEGAALANGEAELRPHLSSVGVGYAPTIDFERPRYRTKRLHRALAIELIRDQRAQRIAGALWLSSRSG